jgi:NadR type nicotinamide-nucleotide adenylyltransferase
LPKKIAITGPESTGKSSLAEELAGHYRTTWVREFAREYLDRLGRLYVYDDLKSIAMGQLEMEISEEARAREYLFCDTELFVIRIWSEHKFGKTDPWILDQLQHHTYDLYLLCDIDLPWMQDPLREHPHLREYFFNIYVNALEDARVQYEIVRGKGRDRLNHAIAMIEDHFKK